MTTPTNGGTNGNGNGNGGYTQKEMLAMVIARLDTMSSKLDEVSQGMAVHEAKPFHDAAHDEVEGIRRGLSENKTRLAAYAGGIAVAVFIVELAARILA